MNWYNKQYQEQNGSCCYCGMSEDKVKRLVVDLVKSKRARTRGTHLEIERKYSSVGKNEYSPTNCALCCYICNNAKSDIFDPKQFKPISKAIRDAIENIVEGKDDQS